MSQTYQYPYTVEPFDPDEESAYEWLERHRDALEFEADSDAVDASVFERALDYLDSVDEEGSRS